MPRLSARRPVAPLRHSAIAPYRPPSAATDAVAAARLPTPTSRSNGGPSTTSASHTSAASATSWIRTAAPFSSTTRERRIGFESSRSIVPCSSSPAIARAPRPIAKLRKISGARVENICPCRYPVGEARSAIPNAACTDGGRSSKPPVIAALPLIDGKNAAIETTSASVESAQPSSAFHSTRIVWRTSSPIGRRLIAIDEQLLEVGLLRRQRDHFMPGDRLDHGVHRAVHREAREAAADIDGVDARDARQLLGADRRGERHGDLVRRGALEVLDPL